MSAPDPNFEDKVREAAGDSSNLGEMEDADSVGTAGSEDCGDMLRMWIKFREEDGRKVIDRASFQTFGCQTALAVASVASRLIQGRTAEDALKMSGEDLAAPLGPLPPMKIHCAQLVETALQQALRGEESGAPSAPAKSSPPTSGLFESLTEKQSGRIVLQSPPPTKSKL